GETAKARRRARMRGASFAGRRGAPWDGARAPLTMSSNDRLSANNRSSPRRRPAPSSATRTERPRIFVRRLGYNANASMGTTNSAQCPALNEPAARGAVGPIRSAGAQAVDEIGEAGLARAAQALGGDDRLHLGDARVEVAVDDDVIVFRPVAHLFGGFRHARGDGRGAVLGARPEA